MAKQTFSVGQTLTAAQMTSLQQTAMGGGSATAKTASYVLVGADAGATVIMNSASATTITVNTSLFASGDSVFIQNIGAGTSTITAGTATVTTSASLALAQWEGGTLYFTSASAAIFIKGAGGAGGGETLISTTTLSGTSVTLASIPQTYNSLYIIISGMTANTSNKRLRGLPNNSDTNTTYSRVEGGGSTIQTTATFLRLLGELNTDRTSASNAIFLQIDNYASTTAFKPINWYGVYQSADYGQLPIFASGAIISNSAITSFVLDYEGTNTFAGGTVLLYGVK